MIDAVEEIAKPLLEEALAISGKQERETALSATNDKVMKTLAPEGQEPRFALTNIKAALKQVSSKYMRKMILEKKRRTDGRSTTDIRASTLSKACCPAHTAAAYLPVERL